MKADVLLGLQWGDEGKGKIVDVFTPRYDVIARFQGGPNAGHTLEFNGIKHVLRTIPSGIFRENSINIIGNGVVIDPVVVMSEIHALVKMGVDVKAKLLFTSPPKMKSTRTVTKTVPLVIIVLLRVKLILLFITSSIFSFLKSLMFSLILSNTITVSFEENPTSVRNAASIV